MSLNSMGPNSKQAGTPYALQRVLIILNKFILCNGLADAKAQMLKIVVDFQADELLQAAVFLD